MAVFYPDGRRFLSFEELDAERQRQRADKADQRAARLAELNRKARWQATRQELQELERLETESFPGKEGADMVSAETKSVIERAKRLYTERLQTMLETDHRNRYVAIEPESGEYFLGDTLDEAVKLASAKYPSRLSHTIWIGHRAAFHLGGMERVREQFDFSAEIRSDTGSR